MARPPAVRACVGCDALAAPSRSRTGLASVTHRTHSDSVGAAPCRRPSSSSPVSAGSSVARLAARLAADPAIERVLGVDTVPPPRDLLRRHGPHRVRARRHPQPADRQGHRRRRRSTPSCTRRIAANPGASGGRTAMKEMNVIGTMQLLAACQKAPTRAAARAEVDHRRLRRQPRATRPLFTEAMRPEGRPVGRLRQGRRRDRGLRARLRPPPSRRRGHRAAVHQLHRPAHRHRAHPLLRAAGRADGARLRRPRAAAARGRRARGARARDEPASCPARSTSAATACCCSRRRSAGLGRIAVPVPGARGRLGRPDRPPVRASSTSRPSRCACSTSAGSSTPRGCAPSSASPRAGPPCRRFDDYVRGRALRPVIAPDAGRVGWSAACSPP